VEDQGFDFKPGQKREAKRFEPPPWERDAFERLQRGRELEAEPTPAPEAPAAQAAEEPENVAEGRADAWAEDRAQGAQPDEATMTEMLADLAAQEPPASRDYLGVSIGAALILGALGGMLVVWGMAALVSAGRTGWMGQVSGVGLGLFGAFFFGMGVWLLYRTLKQRGVL